MLKHVIKLVNTVKSSALNTSLFRQFCEKMDANHYDLLYQNKVQLRSKGNVLQRVCIADRAEGFFTAKQGRTGKIFARMWYYLAYLVDIFGRLNELNISLHGHLKTIISFVDVVSAFRAKRELYHREMTIGKTGMFPTLNQFLDNTEDVRLDDNLKTKVINNFQSACCEFAKYFSDDLAFVANPYLVADIDFVSMTIPARSS